LAQLMADAVNATGITPLASDVLAVTQKIVSKAEGRFVDPTTITPSRESLELAEVTRKDPRAGRQESVDRFRRCRPGKRRGRRDQGLRV